MNTSVEIDYINVWIHADEFDPFTDELGMIRNEYDKNLYGFSNALGNLIKINGLGAISTTASDWTRTIRFAGYRIKKLADEQNANLCVDYVGLYSRTIYFQAFDTAGRGSNVLNKTMNVETAVLMYTDQSVVATDKAAKTSLGTPGTFDSALSSEFSLVTTGRRLEKDTSAGTENTMTSILPMAQ